MYKIYTDGATSNNGRDNAIGGWAYALITDDTLICSRAGSIRPATNNICELKAILEGCRTVIPLLRDIDSVIIYSDSAYCINCVEEKWYKKWIKNNWINSSKQPVKNKELWEQLIPFFDDPRFQWVKVKGHDGNFWNEYVDKLAVRARLENEDNSN